MAKQNQLYLFSGDQSALADQPPQQIVYATRTNPYATPASEFSYQSNEALTSNGDLIVCAAIITFSGIKKWLHNRKFSRRDQNLLRRIEQEMRGRDAIVEPEKEYDEKGGEKHGLYYEEDAGGRPATLNSYTWGVKDGISVNFGHGGRVESFEFHDMGVKIENLSYLLTSRRPRHLLVHYTPDVSKRQALEDMRKAARGLTYETARVAKIDGDANKCENNSVDITQRWDHFWNVNEIKNQPPNYRRLSMSDHKFQ